MLLALVTVVCLGAAFVLAKDTQFLMPGPLASAHATIENCSACHTKSGSGKLSWVHGLVAGDRLADSNACLTCHKMPDTAFNPHSASPEVLKQSTMRLTRTALETPAPQSAHAQSMAFPTDSVVARGLYCATCHQEHQGVNFKLNKISNEQCRSCHVVKFDSFDGHHPNFENYPFKRRTHIIYDHAGHFGKHFPEMAKKDPAKRIPATCSACHDSGKDRRVMAVAPFEQTCTACHLDQITGKERVSGPKGIAFLTLPGLDLQTLRKKKAAIGEWPDASEAELTPFMKVMISRNERGRTLIKAVDGLNLQDLSGASDTQIKAVTNLAWEIKRLFYALIKGGASDVLANLNVGGTKPNAALVTDLIANIPRDVVASAQQQWLPNLGAEMANRPVTSDQKQNGWSTTITESSLAGSASPQVQSGSDARQASGKLGPGAAGSEAPQPKGTTGKADTANAKPDSGRETQSAERPSSAPTKADSDGSEPSEKPSGSEAAGRAPASKAIPNQQACIVRVFGQCLLSKEPEKEAEAVKSDRAARQTDTANAKPDADKKKSSPEELPPAMQAGLKETRQAAQAEGAAGKAKPANSKPGGGKENPSAGEQPQKKATDQTDDLLFPTEEELRAMKAGNRNAGKAAQPEAAAGKADAANAKPDSAASANAASRADANAPAGSPPDSDDAAKPQTRAAPVIGIKSDVDPESWAAYGGWYRQDYAIFYRPTGHKDKFIYSWLFLTGPQAPKGDRSPAAAVFDFLTSKDAQGSCTKCHSVDDIQGKGRVVNFSPPSVESKQGRFTNFIHEPHFGILDNRGCLTCHRLEKGRPYLESFTQGNPQNFASNFRAVSKDLCQTCHTSSKARQDCLTCHKYHVNGVITPIMSTKIPVQ
ncbi:MAG: cytochrome c3 family protein [Bacteroidota bacterium]